MVNTKIVEVPVHPSNFPWYHGKYEIENKKYLVPFEELNISTISKVEKVCDVCGRVQLLPARSIFKGRAKYNKDICDTCIRILIGTSRKGKPGKKWTEAQKESARISHIGKMHSEDSKRRRAISLKRTQENSFWRLKEKTRRDKKKLPAYISLYGPEQGLLRYRKEILTKCPRSIYFWLEKGFSDSEALKKLSEFQKRDLTFFIDKYGPILGESKYQDYCERKSTRRWSKKSKEFFDMLVLSLGLNISDVYYAENEWMISLFKEERGILGQRVLFLDFFDRTRNLVIEFDGFYWHEQSKEKDTLRDEILKNRGYSVIRIPERDYDNDFSRVLTCIRKEYEK